MNGIVVGVDGSPGSRAAIDWAAAEAAAMGTSLHLVHAHRTLPADGSDDPLAVGLEYARERYPRLPVTTQAQPQPPAVSLLRASEDAAMLVVGASERPMVRALVAGSTTLQVITHALPPVIVVRPRPPRAGATPFADHVVVGVDGSRMSEAALHFGFLEAARHDRPLAAVHVEPDTSADSYFDRELLQTYVESTQPGREMLARTVDPWALRFAQVPVKEALVHDRPIRGLLRAAAGAHLLVIGSHAGHVLSGALLGSAALAMAGRAPCPVAVLHRHPVAGAGTTTARTDAQSHAKGHHRGLAGRVPHSAR